MNSRAKRPWGRCQSGGIRRRGRRWGFTDDRVTDDRVRPCNPLHDDAENPAFAPPTAQFATAQAKVLADNIISRTRGRTPQAFHFKPTGIMASLGGYRGVAKISGRRLSGLPAWVLWRITYISMLPGIGTRIRVGLNWLFDYFLPRTIVYMAESDRPATRYLDYAKDEVVQQANEVPAGFYVVISGSLQQDLREPDGKSVCRQLQAGDTWGSRALKEARLTHGKITALEDTRLLLVNSEDFRRLRDTYEPLNTLLTSNNK